MHIEPSSIAQKALLALPTALSERDIVTKLARRLADEIMRYGQGTLPFPNEQDGGDAVVKVICEDLEATLLLAEYLADEDEEAEELSPEELAQRVLDKAEQVQKDLDGGLSVQEAIRRELADTDCGACDHPTCDLYSIALADGSDGDNTKCEPGGPKVTAQVELVMTLGKGSDLKTDEILAIEALAKDDSTREGGLRVLEIGSGRGFAGVVFAQIYPDVQFEILEGDLKRVWFLKRLTNLLGVRNCKVRMGRPDTHLEELEGRYDMVLIKRDDMSEAIGVGLSFAQPGGLLVNWQNADWSMEAADYQRHGYGMRVPLMHPMEFQSAPVKGSVLLAARRPKAPDEEPVVHSEPAAAGDSVAV